MTTFGHIIIGVSCGVLCCPSKFNRWRKILFILPFALMANIPDIALEGWGHDRYYFSHSLFVNLGIMGILLAVWIILCAFFKRKMHLIIVLGAACAWLSHFLLDSFYNHGRGIKIFRPISNSALKLTIPWLSVRDGSIPYFAWSNTKIYLIEVLTFGPVLILCLLLSYFRSKRAAIKKEF